MSAQLTIQGASKRFGGITANDDISLEVPDGKVVGLIGPNGSGKSTLFNSIVGYHPVDGGSIRFESREITRLRTAEIARLGLIRTFQQTHVFVRMTGLQNMAISDAEAGHGSSSSCGRSAETRERAEALLAFCGLYRHLMAGELSFGQRKLLEPRWRFGPACCCRRADGRHQPDPGRDRAAAARQPRVRRHALRHRAQHARQ